MYLMASEAGTIVTQNLGSRAHRKQFLDFAAKESNRVESKLCHLAAVWSWGAGLSKPHF
jgi:hypothetical protein